MFALLEGVCYVLVFVRFRRRPSGKGRSVGHKEKQKAEVRLVWLGVILFVIQAICGAFCTTMGFARTEEFKQVAHSPGQVLVMKIGSCYLVGFS